MSKKRNGFTLIELMVVISIIAILSIIGLVIFTGVQNKAKDSKIRSDLDTIKKAYEANFDPSLSGGQGGYRALRTTDFAGGAIPTQPNGSPYPCAVGPDSAPAPGVYGCDTTNNQGYSVSGTTSTGTVRVTSTQGTISASQLSSCDPGGTLASLSNGLVGYWKFNDQPQGTTVGDTSSSSVTGTWNGSGTHWTSGQLGFSNAGVFNGTNDYVSFATWPSIPGSSFSAAAWFKSTSNFRIGGTQYCGAMPFTLQLSGTAVVFLVNDAAGSCGSSAATGDFSGSSIWHHAVGTFDGTNARLYIDGILVGTGANFTGSYSTGRSDPFVFGRYDCSIGCTYGSGQIDDVRIYNRALTSTEITSLYNMQTTQCVLP